MTKRFQRLEVVSFALSLLAYGYFAVSFLATNGISFDEHLEAQGMVETLRHGYGLLLGRQSSYQSIIENLEYYGNINKIPGLILWLLANPLRMHELFVGVDSFDFVTKMEKSGYYLFTHLTSIFFFLAIVALVLLLSRRLGQRHWLLPGLICLWWPSLVGHSFMNIKDIPFAFLYTTFSYSAVVYCCTLGPQGVVGSIWLRGVLAGLLISLKVPAIAPLLITESVIEFLFYLRFRPDFSYSRISVGRLFFLFVESFPFLLAALVRFLLISFSTFVLVSPSAWTKPAQYFLEAYSLHANHSWGGCTWLSGLCDGKATDPLHWNTFAYILRWFLVQTPAVVLLLIALSFVSLVGRVKRVEKNSIQISLNNRSREAAYIVIGLQAFLLPLMAIVNNSALYGTLRHLSFALPPLAILAMAGTEKFLSRIRNPRMIICCLIFLASVLVVDSFLISPFHYVYMNEFGRILVDRQRTEFDYWGASSGELMKSVAAREQDVYGLVNGYRPMISVYHNVLGRKDVPGGLRFKAEFTVDDLKKPIDSCRVLGSVSRSLIGVPKLRLSRAYICN